MGTCSYCGESAGLLRSIHKECEAKRNQALDDLSLAFSKMMIVERPPTAEIFRAIVDRLGAEARLDKPSLRSKILGGLSVALDAALNDHDLTQDEVDRFQKITDAFDLQAIDLDQAGVTTRLVKALVLKDLTEGTIPARVKVSQINIALKRGESVLWIFNGVRRQEPRTSTHYEGGSHGVSFRIMKGVSYRVGASKGRRVQNTEIVDAGGGDLVITSEALYFTASGNTKKIGLGSVVTVENYDDGIIVTPSRGKMQIFLLDEPVFAANLILKAGAL